jgi:hypothetical protein
VRLPGSTSPLAKYRLEATSPVHVGIIGISCHENGYRLCWSLNRSLHIALARRDSEHLGRPIYDHLDEESGQPWCLLTNHAAEGALLKSMRQVDHFLVVADAYDHAQEDLLERVRKADFVLTAFRVPTSGLRPNNPLLNLFE